MDCNGVVGVSITIRMTQNQMVTQICEADDADIRIRHNDYCANKIAVVILT